MNSAFRPSALSRPQAIYCLLVVLAVGLYGAVGAIAQALLGVAFAILFFKGRNPAADNLIMTCLWLMVAMTVIVLLQVIPMPLDYPVHPSWRVLAQQLGTKWGYVSLNPSQSVFSLPQLLTPFFAYLCALKLFPSDDDAKQLLKALAWASAIIAAFGLFQFYYFPKTLIFAPKEAYLGSLTATFVNRNTAAAFFGLSALVWVALLSRDIMKLGGLSVFNHLRHGRISGEHRRLVIVRGAGILLALVVLFLTQSRAGLSASLFGMALMIALIFFPSRRQRMIGLALISGIVVLPLIFAQGTMYRASVLGIEDLRWCIYRSTWIAIRENWLLGTGFGNFSMTFPPYRDVECGITGIVDRAHNSYLEALLGFGVLIVPIAVIGTVVLVYVLFRGYRDRPQHRYVPALAMGSFALVVVHSLVDFPLQIPGFAIFFAALMAACSCVSLNRTHATKLR